MLPFLELFVSSFEEECKDKRSTVLAKFFYHFCVGTNYGALYGKMPSSA